MKRIMEAISGRRTNKCKGPALSHGYPDTRKKTIMAVRRLERAARGRKESDVITKVFRSRTELRLENKK